jgi:polysaccharide export outer membrane protein
VKTRIKTKTVWGGQVVLPGLGAVCLAVVTAASVDAQVRGQQPADAPANSSTNARAGVVLPTGYVIGPEDVLSIVVWREKDMSADAVVRPDGKITLPLLNDFQAAGLTPDQLRAEVEKAALKYMKEPSATVIVKTINSRKVHVLGSVMKAGTYPLAGDMTVLQAIATAGGLQEYADEKHITVMRKEDGKDKVLKFNYKDVIHQKNLQQNVMLKPGDTVIVP